MKFENTLAFAKALDRTDPLKKFRSRFHLPAHGTKPAVYFTGNSLGLMPKSAEKFVREELADWSTFGVEGHLHSRRPWLYYHKFSKHALAHLTGAKASEVVAMNQLTVNLHLMLISFYKPSGKRFKILTEAGAFSSDQYALESQIRLRSMLSGRTEINPADALIELAPRTGEYCLRTEDIVEAIRSHSDSLALVIFGAVQYYSGQFFDIAAIVREAHAVGAMAGFDLAHAIGNVPLQLHRDQVDFAVWCGYKYLNSGPGGLAGAFVHERYAERYDLPRLAGWWGHHERERFKMRKGFKAMQGVDGWQLSNFPVLAGAAQLASLQIFEEAGMKALRKKSKLLTAYLEFVLKRERGQFEVITPTDPEQRGCQVSILMKRNGRKVFNELTAHGVVADWREPDVIRVAPVPLYNTFEEVFRFGEMFWSAVKG